MAPNERGPAGPEAEETIESLLNRGEELLKSGSFPARAEVARELKTRAATLGQSGEVVAIFDLVRRLNRSLPPEFKTTRPKKEWSRDIEIAEAGIFQRLLIEKPDDYIGIRGYIAGSLWLCMSDERVQNKRVNRLNGMTLLFDFPNPEDERLPDIEEHGREILHMDILEAIPPSMPRRSMVPFIKRQYQLRHVLTTRLCEMQVLKPVNHELDSLQRQLRQSGMRLQIIDEQVAKLDVAPEKHPTYEMLSQVVRDFSDLTKGRPGVFEENNERISRALDNEGSELIRLQFLERAVGEMGLISFLDTRKPDDSKMVFGSDNIANVDFDFDDKEVSIADQVRANVGDLLTTIYRQFGNARREKRSLVSGGMPGMGKKSHGTSR